MNTQERELKRPLMNLNEFPYYNDKSSRFNKFEFKAHVFKYYKKIYIGYINLFRFNQIHYLFCNMLEETNRGCYICRKSFEFGMTIIPSINSNTFYSNKNVSVSYSLLRIFQVKIRGIYSDV